MRVFTLNNTSPWSLTLVAPVSKTNGLYETVDGFRFKVEYHTLIAVSGHSALRIVLDAEQEDALRSWLAVVTDLPYFS